MQVNVESWGRFPRSRSEVIDLHWRDENTPWGDGASSLLPHGMGRSYGDICLNDGNAVLATRRLDRVLGFDASNGVLRAESGMTLDAILRLCLPRGWFPPVTPGTRFVTLGGAIANDVHGKNHHRAGSFGHHVMRFQLRRSDGSRVLCSPDENADWFHHTIGGLGLTGLIEWAELRLKPVANCWVDSETIPFGDLEEFYALSSASEAHYEYLVAWVDSLAARKVGRGIFIRGNHNADPARAGRKLPDGSWFSVPRLGGINLLTRGSIRTFNTAYYWLHRARRGAARVHFGPFFYPLDVIGSWNRLYGPGGLLQWQALLPLASRGVAREILLGTARSGSGSFLTVMKVMGGQAPAGRMSFPGQGVTIALDFPNRPEVRRLLSRLESMVAEAGGRLYPAKDALMTGEHFREFYPQWREFSEFVDPRFSSSFWRRVTGCDG